MTLLLLVLAACDDGQPSVDEDGCWTDPEEAWTHIVSSMCATVPTCGSEVDSTEEECLNDKATLLDDIRASTCFDGCGMVTCAEDLAAYAASCDSTITLQSCAEGTFYRPSERVGECAQAGW